MLKNLPIKKKLLLPTLLTVATASTIITAAVSAQELKFDGVVNVNHIRNDSITFEKVDGGSLNVKVESIKGNVNLFKVDGGSSNIRIIAKEDVRFAQKIDGGSKVYVEARTGNIFFGQKIDGGSEVVLRAPNGKITLFQKIDGGSTVRWCAKQLDAGSQGIRGSSKVIKDCR
ncbi:MAG: hypothetical protein AAFS12_13055 [Cyanobacteria bacterium J06632_19]